MSTEEIFSGKVYKSYPNNYNEGAFREVIDIVDNIVTFCPPSCRQNRAWKLSLEKFAQWVEREATTEEIAKVRERIQKGNENAN